MIRRTLVLVAVGVALAALVPAPAQAQLGKFKDKVKQRVDEKVDKKVDCTLDKYINDKECASEKAAKASSSAAGGAGAGSKAAASAPGQGAWSNYDFVPGERVMFYEDFTRDRVGNFPKRLQHDEGTFEVVEWDGRRWLRATTEGQFVLTLPEQLPSRWTMEFEVTIPWSGMYIYPGLPTSDYHAVQHAFVAGTEVGAKNAERKGSEVDPRSHFGEERIAPERADGKTQYTSRPMHVRIHADGGYMKMYLEELRVVNLPNMGEWKSNQLTIHFRNITINGEPHMPLLTNISINAGGRDMYDALSADGRLALQGIYFDSGSDKIRPESSGTLAEIADMMQQHSSLKITIEGHTDNVGDAAANQKLSEARAAAVVEALSNAPYKVNADRLTSAGFGASKPAKGNDTPEGRQANRRVELVVVQK